METWYSAALWRQLGAALDMLDQAVVACPDALWTEPLWRDPTAGERFPSRFAEFWYVAFHTLTWLDLYLTAVPEHEFRQPAPFARGEIDSNETQPVQPYTTEDLRAYLASLRQRCQSTLLALTEEQACRPIACYPWIAEQPLSYLELQLYNLRHVQEHAAQLCLFLGQHAVPDEALDWVAQARGDADSS